MNCHVCKNNEQIVEFLGYSDLSRTTSDCKPWKSGGKIGICRSCGIVQKVMDSTWHLETFQVYSEYQIYHQSPTLTEQPVFISQTNSWIPRSEAIFQYFFSKFENQLLKKGKILDIGCGNGATLKAMLKFFPEYKRYGFDPTSKNINKLKERSDLKITGCSRELKYLPNTYDVMTMIHVLEHVPDPLKNLRAYVDCLKNDGYFIIAVPNFLSNPFDITIIDHCSHFCPNTLEILLQEAGLNILTISNNILSKEIVAICMKNSKLKKNITYNNLDIKKIITHNTKNLHAQITWLKKINIQVKNIIDKYHNFGVFGTSIAGNWMYSEWSNRISFFIDEDPDRLGTTYRNIPVKNINDLDKNDAVYIAMPYSIAEKIKKKYQNALCKIYIPTKIDLKQKEIMNG